MNKESANKRKVSKPSKEKPEKTTSPGDDVQKKRKLNNDNPKKIPAKSKQNQNLLEPQNGGGENNKGKKAFKQKEKHNQNFQTNQKFNQKTSKHENLEEEKKGEKEDDLNFNSEDGKNMILITKMNKLATKLFDKKKENSAQKPKIIENILGKLGGLLPKLINKRSASKFIQACYKFGTVAQRNKIFDSFKGSDLSEVFKSKYGHFLLVKIVKKGTKDQKNKLFDSLLGNRSVCLLIQKTKF